ncbi:MAG: methionine--tRNA ligase [Candidatus Omnitrophica bacterium]|nr:methionine--tRNA ligase [Candidatus Omnitrophota bacterium]
MAKTFYLTTPLYYVNASPHIGHSYTEVAADCLARYRRLKGEAVFFLTGTDEHGQKIEQAATAAGKAPQMFVDEMVERFKALWTLLGISHDDFIRTTEPRHVTVVQACLTRLHDENALFHATYDGWYCTPCETFWTKDELAATGGSPTCPNCQRPLEAVKEEGWYLPLRRHQDWLRRFLKAHPPFIQPQTRYNEIASLLEQPLPEYLCITRPRRRVGWGIPVPFSDRHVTYVWFDALLNYLSAPGYGVDAERFEGLWPADVHFIGKDILRHHAVYWPIILHALGLSDERMPRLIFAHGWWKIGEQKMSKSLGNIVDPYAIVQQFLKGQSFAADVYRYFLLREVPFGQDGAFSEDAILGRLDADLADDLGNLVNRALSMIERYRKGVIPDFGSENDRLGRVTDDDDLKEEALQLSGRLDESMSNLSFADALGSIFQLVTHANRYIENQTPWLYAKDTTGQERLNTILRSLAEVIRIVSITLEPFMPSVSAAIWQQLGMGGTPRRLADASRWPGISSGQPLGARSVLFPKSEAGAAG